VEQYCGEGLLSLGERPTAVVSGGAWVAQARLGRASGCGAAAQEQRARVWASAGGGAVKSSGAEAEGRRRSGGGGAAYGRGYKGGGFARRKKNSVKLTRGARGRFK